MPRQRSYETEKRYRTARFNRAIGHVKEAAFRINEATPGSLRMQQASQDMDLALAFVKKAAINLNYLEWEVRGAGDE